MLNLSMSVRAPERIMAIIDVLVAVSWEVELCGEVTLCKMAPIIYLHIFDV